MRNFLYCILIITILGCQNRAKKNPFIGTWNRCLKDGEYLEFKIYNNYTISLSSSWERIIMVSNKFENNTLIIEGINVPLANKTDTIFLTSKSNDKIILKSRWMNQVELNRTENKIDDIDSLNLENWKKKTILKFKKRAALFNCPDLRTEDEKIIDTLRLLEPEEYIEIPIERLKDSLN